jgi:hypothetical protein
MQCIRVIPINQRRWRRIVAPISKHMQGKSYGCGSTDHTKKDGNHKHNMCNHCGKTGHRLPICFTKYIRKPAKGAKAVATNDGSTSTSTPPSSSTTATASASTNTPASVAVTPSQSWPWLKLSCAESPSMLSCSFGSCNLTIKTGSSQLSWGVFFSMLLLLSFSPASHHWSSHTWYTSLHFSAHVAQFLTSVPATCMPKYSVACLM